MTGLIEKTSFLPFAGFSSHAKQVCSASQPSVTQQKDHGRTFTSLTLAYPPPFDPAPNRGWSGNRSVHVCWAVGGWAWGIVATEKVLLEEGPPRLRAGQKSRET